MGTLLNLINGPEDLQQVPRSELPRLAREIREVILDVVSRSGGHLASNLGAVELTIALHYVFDSPRDKIIWDVGHQTYTHKLLTGRRDAFATLRQRHGISGFVRPDESVHDVVVTGHGGTSISTALGFAEARDHLGEHHKVIAVIGDGSLSTGMAFEGLNNAGALRKDFIVVLNDNEMSISPNVGALSTYLSQLLTGRLYIRFRKDVEAFLRSIPGVGEQMRKMAKGAEESLKAFLTPGILFEVLGFKYVGPLKGHELYDLIDAFERVKELDCPALVHVYTKKGKGYPPAEKDPVHFHGIGPFDLETGRERKRGPVPTYTEVFGKTLVTLARDNPRVVAITAAMPHGTGLAPFSAEFPDRFYDVGMAEQHAVGFAAGLAARGMRPVVAIYSTFLQRAYDQIMHDVCIGKLPVVFALDRAGIVGEDGPTHQGCFDYSYLRSLPNMVVMAPKDENELQHMLLTAIEHPGPVALRYPRGTGCGVPLDTQLSPLAIGKGEVLAEGEDVAILAIGNMVPVAVASAQALRADGIGATVVNARFVKPLDSTLILSLASQIGRIVTVEENALQGGFGSAVLELFEEKGLKGVKVRRLGLPDRFIEHGSPASLREEHGLTCEAVCARTKELLGIPLRVQTGRLSPR